MDTTTNILPLYTPLISRFTTIMSQLEGVHDINSANFRDLVLILQRAVTGGVNWKTPVPE